MFSVGLEERIRANQSNGSIIEPAESADSTSGSPLTREEWPRPLVKRSGSLNTRDL